MTHRLLHDHFRRCPPASVLGPLGCADSCSTRSSGEGQVAVGVGSILCRESYTSGSLVYCLNYLGVGGGLGVTEGQPSFGFSCGGLRGQFVFQPRRISHTIYPIPIFESVISESLLCFTNLMPLGATTNTDFLTRTHPQWARLRAFFGPLFFFFREGWVSDSWGPIECSSTAGS